MLRIDFLTKIGLCTLCLLFLFTKNGFSQCGGGSCGQTITTATATINGGTYGCVSGNSNSNSNVITVNGTLYISGNNNTLSNITIGSGGLVRICGTGNVLTINSLNTSSGTYGITIDAGASGNSINQLTLQQGTLTITNNLAAGSATDSLKINGSNAPSITGLGANGATVLTLAGTGKTYMYGGLSANTNQSSTINISGGSITLGNNDATNGISISLGNSVSVVSISSGASLTSSGSIEFGSNAGSSSGFKNLGSVSLGKNINGYSLVKSGNTSFPIYNGYDGSTTNASASCTLSGGLYMNSTSSAMSNYGTMTVGVNVSADNYSWYGGQNSAITNQNTGILTFAGGLYFNSDGGNVTNYGTMSIGRIATFGTTRNASIFYTSTTGTLINGSATYTSAKITATGTIWAGNNGSGFVFSNFGCFQARNIFAKQVGTNTLYGGSNLNLTGTNSIVNPGGSGSTSLTYTSNSEVAVGDYINATAAGYVSSVTSLTAATLNSSCTFTNGTTINPTVYSIINPGGAYAFTYNNLPSGGANIQAAGLGIPTGGVGTVTASSSSITTYYNGTPGSNKITTSTDGGTGANPNSCSASSITLSSSNPAVATANITQNSTNNVVYSFNLTVANVAATLNSVVFANTGNAVYTTDLTNYKLYYTSTSSTFASSTCLGTITSGTTFGSLTQNLAVGGPYYFWITSDVVASPTALRTITISAITTAGLTFASGNKLGTAYAGGTQTLILTPPTLTAASSPTVDAAFDVTFTENAAWRNAITSITIGGTTLTAGYSTASSGKITFTPSASTPANLLQSNGSKSIVIIANGYTNASVTQALGVGIANKLSMNTQPTAPNINGAVLATQPVVVIQDQYGNATTSTATIAATATSGLWTIGGTTSKAGVSGTATFTDLTAGYSSSVSGATITFTSSGLTSVVSSAFNVPSLSSITLASASQLSSGNISQSATKQALSAFTFAVSSADAQISSLVFTTSGTYVAADITKFQLWYNTSNSIGTATKIGSDITSSLGSGSHTFTGLTQAITSGTTGYLWITTDVSIAATVSNTITVASIATSDLTVVSGSKSGSITAGGTQTIQIPASTITLASPNQTSAAYVGRNWANTDVAAFTLSTATANTSLTQIDFTTTGSIVDADLTNFKLWYNSTNTLDGATPLGSSITASKGAGSHSFTGLAHLLTAGTTEYYWITIDVAAGATNTSTISVSAFTTANFYASGTKSGSTTAGGTQTVATPVTYYSIANGSWISPSSWSTTGYAGSAGGGYPTDVDIVNIGNSKTITMTAVHNCTDITIDPTGVLADGGYTLQVFGNLTSNGTYSGSGKVTLINGHGEHVISSTNDNTLYKLELNDTWGAVITNSASSIKTTTITNLVLTSGMLRIGDFNNGGIYNKLTFSNAFTIASGATFKLDGNCNGDITFSGNITIASGGTWTGTAGKTCASLKFATDNMLFTNNSSAQIDNSSSTYIFGYNQTLAGGLGMNVYNLNCSSNFYQTQMTGIWTCRNTCSLGGAAQTNNGNLYVNGTLSLGGNFYNSTSAFTLHLNSTLNLANPGAAWGCKIEIGGTVTLTGDNTFRTDIGSSITIDTSATLDCSTYSIKNVGGSKLTSSDVTNNGTLKFAGATNGFATPVGTVEYNGVGTQTVYAGSYNNLIISGARSSNTITLDNSGTINVAGSFNTSASACTWTTTGTTIAFNGSTAQSMASTFTFNNLTINNSSSTGVTLNAAVNVGGALTLTDGFVYTTTSNILTVNSGGTSSGGSDASHVEGPMQKIGSTSFDFPVGKSGIWAKIGFTTAGGFDGSTTMSAEYFYTASTNSSNVGAGIHNVSKVEYWDITRVSDPSNDASCNVTLYFNNKTRSKIAGTGTDLKTVHYESGVWTNKGGTFHDNGDGTGYIVSTTALTSFSPETVGSTDGTSSLPIELTNFKASISEDKVLILWSTASELNNQFFTLERSTDGITWEQIYTCNGAGTSTKTHYYDYYDNDDINGQVYYRLKQTDIDGTTTISDVRTVQYTKNDTLLLVYPNPAKMDDMIISIEVPSSQIITILISNSMGTIVSEGKVEAMEKQVKIKLNEICRLQPGIYSILVRGRDCIKNKEIIIQ